MTFLYFAYGSNMLTARLKSRCDSASAVGNAYANNRMIQFSKLSCDGSGKATLRPAQGKRTPGVLFEIQDMERDALDCAEGFPNGYDRCDAFPVHRPDGQMAAAVTYLARSPEQGLSVFDWYLALVIAGAREHCLDDEYVEVLRKVACIPDPIVGREERRKALQALASAGYPDYRQLFS